MEKGEGSDVQDPPLPPRVSRKLVFFELGDRRKGIELSRNSALTESEFRWEVMIIISTEFELSSAGAIWLCQFDEEMGCEIITPISSFPCFDDLPPSSYYQIRHNTTCRPAVHVPPTSSPDLVARGWTSQRHGQQREEEDDEQVSDWENELVDEEEKETEEVRGEKGEEQEEEEEEEEDEEVTAQMMLTDETRELILNAETVISNAPTWENDRYFQEYGELGIHVGMLGDQRRNLAYYDSIFSIKKDLLKGKVVLDVGCGTGVLSCFCAKAGASRVYAVEASAMANNAQKVFRKNGLEEIITLLHGRMEDVEVPEKVDLIVSEWMGCFLVFESMLESVLFARDKYLKEGGLIFPTTATLYLAPVEVSHYMSKNVNIFSDVCGVDLSPLLPVAVKNACEKAIKSRNFPPESVIAPPKIVMEMDLRTVKQSEFRVLESSFSFDSFQEGASFHGFSVWFDVRFIPRGISEGETDGEKDGEKKGGEKKQLKNFPWKEKSPNPYEIEEGDLVFSTSPEYGKTHWGQDVFLFTDVFAPSSSSSSLPEIKPKEISGTFVYSQNGHWRRHWDVDFSFCVDGTAIHKHFLL
uniref:Methyltransferase domain-containing protein n=1 Tax=Paramoeba aestuarina TaxID=180227 RepID=A0A7S4UBK2_9EUKA|eukprot:CAMPEP_0201508138 /NCGR_PEP_ID=MMETSP0161_2-20130828/1586_1 /ASSEMBLY_ACC=CAM_ASM_000251 /TAXON_ID=180227 /ORGANISM="Neoparamoeba aestuarina, Strain SoJaBio B1-5/56/2" /LENGTH=581 /DNA_ID=CAMNT_0047902703 /DNA_START=62 /DNA_END=1807 /DNA_ORIENTATION=-